MLTGYAYEKINKKQRIRNINFPTYAHSTIQLYIQRNVKHSTPVKRMFSSIHSTNILNIQLPYFMSALEKSNF